MEFNSSFKGLKAVSSPSGGVDGSQKFPAMFCDDRYWCGLVVHPHDPSPRRNKWIHGAVAYWEAEQIFFGQGICRLLYKLKIPRRVHEIPPLHTVNHFNRFKTFSMPYTSILSVGTQL